MDQEDVENNRKIGEFGNSLIKPKDTILTHCNAEALQPEAMVGFE